MPVVHAEASNGRDLASVRRSSRRRFLSRKPNSRLVYGNAPPGCICDTNPTFAHGNDRLECIIVGRQPFFRPIRDTGHYLS